jgi:hypothetical protein
MVAPNPGNLLDIWQWTANVFTPLGQANDGSIRNDHDPANRGGSIVQDPSTGGTVNNANADNTAPTLMQDPSKTPLYGPNYLAVSQTIALDVSKLKAGDLIPRTMLAPYQGDRADIDTKVSYASGQYTLVFHRKLDTGQPDDAKFVVGNTYAFGLGVWDALDNENHTVTAVAYHLLLK